MRSTIALLTLLLAVSCTKEETAPPASTNIASTVSSHLSRVSDEFSPGALSSASSLTSDENPCEGTNGLIDCQPNLLKLYLAISKQQLDMVRSALADVGAAIGQVADGASGSVTVEDGNTVDYSKTDSDSWTFTLNVSGTPAAYISVEGTTYTLEIDLAALGEGETGQFQSIISYTDENTWSLTNTMLTGTCDAADVRAPTNARILVAKADGLWKGKAMLYHPRWAQFSPDPTCATSPSDSIALNMYSDFVGDDTVAKMNVYMVKRTRAANEIASHPLSDICSEYAICSGGTLGAETPSQYPNSVCVAAATGDGTWNSDCSSTTSSSVGAAAFGAASDWVAPSSFHNMTITVGP